MLNRKRILSTTITAKMLIIRVIKNLKLAAKYENILKFGLLF